MIPDYLNSSSSPFPVKLGEDHDQAFQLISPPNHQAAASSSSHSYHIFFNSTQDQTGYYQSESYHPQQQGQDDINNASHGGSYDPENKLDYGLKLSLWKNKEHKYEINQTEKNPVKWMSSKMRLMQKMKNTDRSTVHKAEDQKQPSSSLETDNYSSNSSSNYSNSPVRVCADCNTTKTPLWRSGPKGPKSLCNACGIRQRKARRAMAAAAAAAAANGTVLSAETPMMKIKVQHKEKLKNNNNHTAQLKKRCKLAAAAGPSDRAPEKKLQFEDFLVNISKNLAFHRVFPQDEKEAAILLMALSCGLVHG